MAASLSEFPRKLFLLSSAPGVARLPRERVSEQPSERPDRRMPWLKFFGGDWRQDPNLRACSFAARGLWMDCLTLMHEASPYGYLLLHGDIPSPRELSRMLGGQPGEISKLLGELGRRGVAEVSTNGPHAGALYSRRMVREQHQRDADRERQRIFRDKAVTWNGVNRDNGRDNGVTSDVTSADTERDKPSDKAVTLAPARDPARVPEARGQKERTASKEPAAEQSAEKKAENAEIGKFLKRFCELYTQHRNAAIYRVHRTKHVPIVRSLLVDFDFERLVQLAEFLVMLTAETDAWIANTDRGIEILSAKATFLDNYLKARSL